MLFNGWHSDRTGERRWHASIPLVCAGAAYLLIPGGSHFSISMALLAIGGAAFYSFYPAFWSMPTMVFTGTAAAASFGLINSIALIGGFIGPYAVGWLNDRTGGLSAAFLLIAACYLLAGLVLALIRISSPSAPLLSRTNTNWPRRETSTCRLSTLLSSTQHSRL